jgi:hypothetical protein
MATIFLHNVQGLNSAPRNRAVPRGNIRREAATLKSIMDWFAWQGIRCERLNSGAVRQEDRFFRFGFPGCPDLMVLDQRLPVGFIEVKAPGGRMSKGQREFQQFCHDHKIPHLVAATVEEISAWWDKFPVAP